jgi:hypothetical protein
MVISRLMVINAAALAASMWTAHAGPSSPEIGQMQSRFDVRLEARAAAGRQARENSEATMHRQPTPGSIAAAEERLGELSSSKIEVAKQAMELARAADSADDKSACEQALADAQRATGPRPISLVGPQAISSL